LLQPHDNGAVVYAFTTLKLSYSYKMNVLEASLNDFFKFQLESPFAMKQPDDLVAFIRQERTYTQLQVSEWILLVNVSI